MSGAQNKAADCLSRLVDLPTGQASHNSDDLPPPTMIDLHSTPEIGQHNSDIPQVSTLQPKEDTVTPDITKITDTPATTQKLLTEDRLQALLQMQKTDPFCKHASPSI